MGSATSFYTTFQQLMLSMGICAGAAALQGAMVLRGHHLPKFVDFTAAFWTVALFRSAPRSGTGVSTMMRAMKSAGIRRVPGRRAR